MSYFFFDFNFFLSISQILEYGIIFETKYFKYLYMDDNFSPRVKDVITFSKEEALRLGHDHIGTEHLVLGILRDGGGKAITILNAIDIDLDNLRKKVEILNPALLNNNRIENTKKNLHLTRQAERALKTTFLEAKLFQSNL